MIPLWRRSIGRIFPGTLRRRIKRRLLTTASRRFHGTTTAVHRFSIDNKTATLRIEDVTVVLPLREPLDGQKHSDWLVTHPEDVLELDVFLKLARQADGLMFDVGAHHGVFAAFFCKVSNHHAVCFEPVAESQTMIQKTAKLNDLGDRLEMIPAALGDKVDVITLYRQNGTGYAQAEDYASSSASALPPIAAPVTTIDAVRSSADGKLALLKIDVEGMENEVLRGAARTLCRERPVVLLELHCDYLAHRGVRPWKVLSELVDHGYSLMRLNGRHMSVAAVARTILSRVHLVAVPKERRSDYESLLLA